MIFGYGDLVRIKCGAPAKLKPGVVGSVVSFYEVETKAFETRTGFAIGTILIGIETGDGTYLEVPLEFVTGLEELDSGQ